MGKRKKKKNKNKNYNKNYKMNNTKISRKHVGFGFYKAQIRDRGAGFGFVLQIDDPSFHIEGEEILLDYSDVSDMFQVQLGGSLCEITGCDHNVSGAFKKSFEKLLLEEKPSVKSLFSSNTLYYPLEGRNGGLFYKEQMILSFNDLLRIFSKATKQFISD